LPRHRQARPRIGRTLQMVSEPTLVVSWGACGVQLRRHGRMAGVGPKWSHNMAHALSLATRTWLKENVPNLRLIDEGINLLRG
jgi:hypothetical protein